jgi:Zn-dependent peptidase ImmA (M78 family)/transcriptional regulator with XRE-family HTH domain
MNASPNPEMLILARESRGLTQIQLAEATSVQQATISKYETGFSNISEEHLEQFANVLEYPKEFFYLPEQRYGFGTSCTYHRKQKTISGIDLKRLQAELNILRIRVSRLLDGADVEYANQIQPLDIDEFDGNAERIAQLVRSSWGLPFGPVVNLIRAVENAGGIVVRRSFGTKKVDALSQWLPKLGIPPLLYVNADIAGDRLRFTLAHELGHLIMHRTPTPDMEQEADRFAAEFLMPADEIGAELESLTLSKLAQLKVRWRVSMAALIKHAYHLEKITHRQYRSLYEQLSKMGYRLSEPIALPIEEPLVINEIINVHVKDHRYSPAELSQLLFSTESEFRTQFWPTRHGLRAVG